MLLLLRESIISVLNMKREPPHIESDRKHDERRAYLLERPLLEIFLELREILKAIRDGLST
jgi:hypothetical protein